VETVIDALHRQRPVHLACSESRPAGEGRGLARRLAAAGVAVTLFGDAAIAHALSGCDAVVVGADAVSPDWFLNKSGTRMLAAAAAQQGVPVYVAAARDKFVTADIAARLRIREGVPDEIWNAPPSGIDVRNPYFEQTPLDLLTGVISDAGVLGAGMVADVCRASFDPAALALLE
jgi:translation initiation factor eIF-2B subunit delta